MFAYVFSEKKLDLTYLGIMKFSFLHQSCLDLEQQPEVDLRAG